MLQWSLFGVLACLVAGAVESTPELCKMTSCNRGGQANDVCTISSGSCPPCLNTAKACFVYDPANPGKCPFPGMVDCQDYFTSLLNVESSASGTGSSSPSSTKKPASTHANNSSNSTVTHGSNTSEKSTSDSSKSTSKGGSNSSVVFAIVGAAIGVVAVAVIFLTLVRRSQAADEDDEDIEPTPQTYHKPYQNNTELFNGAPGVPSAMAAGSSAAPKPSSRYYDQGNGTLNNGGTVPTSAIGMAMQQPAAKPVQMVHRTAAPTAVPVAAPSHVNVSGFASTNAPPAATEAAPMEKHHRDSYEF